MSDVGVIVVAAIIVGALVALSNICLSETVAYLCVIAVADLVCKTYKATIPNIFKTTI